MINLYQTPPKMSLMGAVCDSLGKTFLLLLVNNLGATGGLRMNSSPVKVKLITLCSCPRGMQYCGSHLRQSVTHGGRWKCSSSYGLVVKVFLKIFEQEGELVHQLLSLLLRCLLNSPVYTGSVKYYRYFEHCNDKSSTNETSLLCWLQQNHHKF